jgi:hypothetical protein
MSVSLQQIEAEIARRQQAQQPRPASVQPVAAVTPSIVDIDAEIARRQAQPSPGEIARAPGGVLTARPESRAVRELPEIASGGLLAGEPLEARLKGAGATLLTTDPEELARILPTISPNVGITRTPEGDLLATNNETGAQVVINKPGLSTLDVIQGLGIATAFTPGAAVASIPAKVGARAAIGATTAGLTETAIQAIQQQLGGELNPEEIALATSLGGGAELVVPAIQALRQQRQARRIGAAGEEIEDVSGRVAQAQEAVEATGVPLTQAQQTTIPAQLEKQAFITQLPAGTKRSTDFLRKQNEAVSTAVEDFLGQLAPDQAVITGAGRFRTAAQNAVERQKIIRKEKASPIYNQAFDQGADVNLSPVNDLIKSELTDLPASGEIAKTINRVSKLIGDSPSLKKLHNAKIEIDQIINKVGEGSVGNTTKSKLKDIQSSLLNQMDEGSDLYRQARETFAAESPAVGVIQDSIIGKVAALDDTQLKTIARRIFDPAETNPAVIRQAKKIIDDVDPDAWNELLRTELERRMGAIRSTLEEGTTENVPGQLFNALFGNEKQRRVLFNAVDGETGRNLKYLQTVLGRARLGRAPGSPTAAREEIKQELRGGAVSSVRDFFKAPVSTLVSTGEDAAFNKRVRVLADALFDPQWKPRVSALRKLKTNSPAAARAMTQLLQDVEGDKE